MADTSWMCTMIPASLPTMTNETIPPVAIKAAQRFPIRLSHPLLRVLFLLFFARRSNCYVKVGEGAMTFRMGPLFRLAIPSDGVAGARLPGWAWPLGWG